VKSWRNPVSDIGSRWAIARPANLILQKDQLVNNRDQAGDLIRRCLDNIDSYRNKAFSSIIRRQIDRVGPSYIDVIKSLDAEEASQGTVWLQQIVDE
jgi:hypothetical protein